MKTSILLSIGTAVALCPLAAVNGHAQTIESMPPVVVKTVPESGAMDVMPGEMEIKVTFSKAMTDGSWSWSTAWKDSTPESADKPRYEADGKTCVMKVKLEPNKTYAYWLNSQNFHNFRDQQGHSAVPYLLVFHSTSKAANSELKGDSEDVLRQKLQFAELELKTAEKQFAAGVITQEDYGRTKSAVAIARAELNGDPVEIARYKAQLAEMEFTAAEKKFQVGLATQSEYDKAKSALAIAKTEYAEAVQAAKSK
jgi:hypothetical protein